jgi:CheY-like chemotaxis protein
MKRQTEILNSGESIVRLPVSLASPAVDEGAAPVASTSQRPLRIVVADDNLDAAESLAIYFGLEGHEVKTAHDGSEAVRAVQEFQADFAFLDLGMPEMDGLEAARQIRKHPWGAGVVLVALTGWGQEEDKRKTREAGFDHHFVKPADPVELVQLLKKSAP